MLSFVSEIPSPRWSKAQSAEGVAVSEQARTKAKANQVTLRIDRNKEVTINFWRYTLPLADRAGILEYFQVEEALQQTAARSR